MTLDAKLAALEHAYAVAQQNHLTVAATQSAGAVKREVRELLLASPLLRDLFPSSLFTLDAHASTTALLAALAIARGRIEASAASAGADARRASALLEEARALARAKADKSDAKRRALALLEASFPDVYTKHVTWVRRQVRTEHAPSSTLVAALRDAQRAAGSPEVDALLATLDSLATRTELKANVNAFLASAAGGRVDVRPRRFVRIDHAPTASLVQILEQLESAYLGAADPARRKGMLDGISSLEARLVRRRSLKEERDRCLGDARALASAIAADQARARVMLGAIARELTAFEEEAERGRARVREAEGARFERALEVEAAVRAREAALARMDALFDDLPLPDSAEAAAARRVALGHERTRLRPAVISARTALLRTRGAYERALAAALSSGAGATLPAGDDLRDHEDALLALERELARVDVESELVSALEGDASAAHVAAVRADLAARLAIELTEQTTALAAAQGRRDAADRELERLENELGASEARVVDAVRVRAFCVAEHERVAAAMVRCEELRRSWDQTDTLVHYVRFSEDVGERLRQIAKLVAGRRDTADAMGRVRVALLVDAGVRAGVALGFVDLYAELRLTVLVSGTLAVIDSREVVFESHLALFVSAGATARVDLGAPLRGATEALGAGDVLTVPDVLLEASAKCKVTLHDARACAVYDDAGHWAARWAHEIARRIAFVRSVELTREGFRSIDEAWLDAQVARLAAASGGLPWLRDLAGPGARPGRDVTVASADVIEASASATLGSASRSVGDSLGDAKLLLSEGAGPEVRMTEVSLDFVPKKVARKVEGALATSGKGARPEDPPAPSGFRGTVVYHALEVTSARPRTQSAPRAYLEISMTEAHALSVGPLRLASAGTAVGALASSSPDAFRRHRALATSLDVEAHAHFEREVALPPVLAAELDRAGKASGAAAPAAQLARTMRLRLDLVVARGEPHALTTLLGKVKSLEESVSERLEGAAERASHARALGERLDAALRDHGEAIARVAPLAKDLVGSRGRAAAVALSAGADAVRERAEALHEDLASRVAELKECLTLLENSHAVYARYVRSWACSADGSATKLSWSPVWVAQVHRGLARRTFTLEGEVGVDVLPLVRVFVGAKVDVEAESAEFEAVSARTTTYLKSLLASMAKETWSRYWELHKGEVFDLCAAVATPGSVPFSEVVLDALEGRAELAPLARAFGDACWRLFRDDASPFAAGVFGEDAVVLCLQGRLGAAPASGARIPLTKAQVLPFARPKPAPAEAFVTRRNLERVRVLLTEPFLVSAERESGRAFEGLLDRALRAFQRAEHLKLGIVRRYEGAGVERGTLDEVHGRTCLTDALRSLRDGEARAATAAAALPSPGAALPDRLATARALVALLEERLERHGALDADLRKLVGAPPAPAEAGDLLPSVVALRGGIFVAAAVLGAPRDVPAPSRWRSGSAVSFLMRSGATARLDEAVLAYDAQDLGVPPPTRRRPVALEDAYAASFEHVEALGRHLAAAERLGSAVEAWFGDKDEGSSKRGPSVAAVLELPLRRTQRRLCLALAVVLLTIDAARCLDELGHLEDGVLAAEDRAALTLQRAFRHRHDARDAERLTAAAVKLQRAFRARRASRTAGATPLAELRTQLEAYLRAGAPDFRLDAVSHGRKKVLLRGETFPVHEVPEA